jgi:hypothetical protein
MVQKLTLTCNCSSNNPTKRFCFFVYIEIGKLATCSLPYATYFEQLSQRTVALIKMLIILILQKEFNFFFDPLSAL